jgi:hypothetical protein
VQTLAILGASRTSQSEERRSSVGLKHRFCVRDGLHALHCIAFSIELLSARKGGCEARLRLPTRLSLASAAGVAGLIVIGARSARLWDLSLIGSQSPALVRSLRHRAPHLPSRRSDQGAAQTIARRISGAWSDPPVYRNPLYEYRAPTRSAGKRESILESYSLPFLFSIAEFNS